MNNPARTLLQTLRIPSSRTGPRFRAVCRRHLSGQASGSQHYLQLTRTELGLALGLTSAATLLGIYHFQKQSRLECEAPAAAVSVEQPSGQKLISADEVAKHNTQEDCWVIIEGNVYDVTDFLEAHPGGIGPILKLAGGDATEIFKPLHPPGTLEDNLAPEQKLGPVDPTTVKAKAPRPLTKDEKRVREARENLPDIETIINLYDMEKVAESVLSYSAWAYYRSAANTEETFRENQEAWDRYWFRPRVLRSATTIDPSSTFLGTAVTLPIYIAPAAMAKLGHPLGEVNLTRAAGRAGIIQGISANASCSLEEMVDAKVDGQELVYQIYLNRDRSASEKILKKVEGMGFKAVMFTVDSARSGYRELDVRAKGVPDEGPGTSQPGVAPKKVAGIAAAISGYQDENLTWDDIAFIRKNTKLPIILKGIQSVDDVELAAKHGVAAVILSNHGGRSLNFSPAPIDVLYEMRVTKPELFNKLEVYLDSGVRRGTDVVKALALGAKGVGLGRAFLYANSAYGEEGAMKVYEMLYNEVVTTMALVGARTVDELTPEMVRPKGWLPPSAASK